MEPTVSARSHLFSFQTAFVVSDAIPWSGPEKIGPISDSRLENIRGSFVLQSSPQSVPTRVRWTDGITTLLRYPLAGPCRGSGWRQIPAHKARVARLSKRRGKREGGRQRHQLRTGQPAGRGREQGLPLSPVPASSALVAGWHSESRGRDALRRSRPLRRGHPRFAGTLPLVRTSRPLVPVPATRQRPSLAGIRALRLILGLSSQTCSMGRPRKIRKMGRR